MKPDGFCAIMLAPHERAQVRSSLVALLTMSTKVLVLFSSPADTNIRRGRKTEFPIIRFASTDGKRRTNILFPKVRHISRKISTPLLMV